MLKQLQNKYVSFLLGSFIANLLLRIDTDLPWWISGETLVRAIAVSVTAVLLMMAWDKFKKNRETPDAQTTPPTIPQH
jgi:hypothetical protein